MSALSAARRRVEAVEAFNDSPTATYSRTLCERNPYTRSSTARIVVSSPLLAHEWALIAASALAFIVVAAVISAETFA